ncbi:SDR family NAD(P)-dependent oxidoreductase [Sphingomonas sp.]|uniref:SDR family NAD(P)-dependent oxidoreductase n=1 Tax=Sphingomonas sp. TaxID=28214 RepID=UPI003D6D7A17
MLDGKIAIVTGGGTGIGAATAALLAKNGAHVIVTSELAVAAMQPVVDRIVAAGGSAEAATCDVMDRAAIAALFAGAERAHGKVDILVQSAGVCFWGPIEDMSAGKIDTMFGVNTIGPISMIQAAIPVMRRAGGGAIVNISSGAAVLGVNEFAVYAATKAAIAHFTRTLAPELRRSNIRVNSIGPGSVRTQMLGFTSDELTPEQQEAMVRREARSVSPYGNAMMEPDDIAQVVLFLVSDAARALQGSFLLADQGISSAMLPPAS